jgi:hypothetical protein
MYISMFIYVYTYMYTHIKFQIQTYKIYINIYTYTGVNKTKKTNEGFSSKDVKMKETIKAWNYNEACSKHVSRRYVYICI